MEGEGGGCFSLHASGPLSIRDIGAAGVAGGARVVRNPSGAWGWKTPSGVRGGAPRCWGCVWPPDSEGGRGRVRAAWLPPARIDGAAASIQGGNHASLAARLKLFLRAGYGGAWNGAQAEVARARGRLARCARGTDECVRRHTPPSAGARCRSRSGVERAGVPDKKRIWVSPCPGRCERSECRCAATALALFGHTWGVKR